MLFGCRLSYNEAHMAQTAKHADDEIVINAGHTSHANQGEREDDQDDSEEIVYRPDEDVDAEEDVEDVSDDDIDEEADADEDADDDGAPSIDSANIMSTHGFAGTRVVGGKKGTSRIGKVDRFVFHPTERRCIGFMVKRPDAALMFHRKPLFVSLDGFRMEDGRVRIEYNGPAHQGDSAFKRLGVDGDECVLWEGMPLVSVSGIDLGYVGDIQIDRHTGNVVNVVVDSGATKRMILGSKNIPGSMIRGFRTGIGCELATMGHEGKQEDDAPLGAILVSDKALQVKTEGGLAEAAGKGTAKLNQRIRKASKDAQPKVDEVSRDAKTEINAAAYATGRQISRTKGMFTNFKKEYDKAVSGKGTYDQKDYEYLEDTEEDKERGKGMFSQFKENFDKALNSDDSEDGNDE